MKIYGLQKVSLLDFPCHVACTVFLGGCDFRCPYCHNMELAAMIAPPAMDDEEFFAFLKKRQGILDGVAISGGEPCIHSDLPDFIKKIRELGFKVKLDTNGTHPKMLRMLLDSHMVDYVAMDIKNSLGNYHTTCGVEKVDLTAIQESIQLLMNSDIEYEFRTTVVKEFFDDSSFEGISQLIAGARAYYLQSFTDRETVPCHNLHAPSKDDMLRYADICRKTIPNVSLRGID